MAPVAPTLQINHFRQTSEHQTNSLNMEGVEGFAQQDRPTLPDQGKET